jgi:hypothetical protein
MREQGTIQFIQGSMGTAYIHPERDGEKTGRIWVSVRGPLAPRSPLTKDPSKQVGQGKSTKRPIGQPCPGNRTPCSFCMGDMIFDSESGLSCVGCGKSRGCCRTERKNDDHS